MTTYFCTGERTRAYNTNKKVSSFIYILHSDILNTMNFIIQRSTFGKLNEDVKSKSKLRGCKRGKHKSVDDM